MKTSIHEYSNSSYINPTELAIGLYVHLDLEWMQHPFIFSSFKIRTQKQLEQIRKLNLKKIRIDNKLSDFLPEFPKTIPLKREKSAQSRPADNHMLELSKSNKLIELNKKIMDSEIEFEKNSTKLNEALRCFSYQTTHAKDVTESLVDEMVASLHGETDAVIHAISQNKHGHENYVHPFNVLVLTMILAKSLKLSGDDIKALGIAAACHDIGKNEAPDRKAFLDMHCELGAQLAKRAGFSDHVVTIIEQHHEYFDGSGFPKNLKRDGIDRLAKILSVCNFYDNLCNPKNPDEAMTPHEAMSHMYGVQQHKFDPEILRTFVRSLGIYPPGSIVQLTNGLYGSVILNNPDSSMLPTVMLYMPEVVSSTPLILDLEKEGVLTIKRCIKPKELPAEIYQYLKPKKRVCFHFLKMNNQPMEIKSVANMPRAANTN